jgi:hypothetical protein
VEELASSVSSTEDVYFVPCFTGLFTPHWDVSFGYYGSILTLFGFTLGQRPWHNNRDYSANDACPHQFGRFEIGCVSNR